LVKFSLVAATTLLALIFLTGCASDAVNTAAAPSDDGLENTAPGIEAEDVPNKVVPFEEISSAATCIFSPDELSAAYSSWSDYEAGPGIADTSSSQASCEYAHLDPALQYVATPFTIWVEGFSYADPDMAARAGYEDLPASDGLSRGVIADHYCPSDGTKPAEVTWMITCETNSDATIIVFDDFSARVVRDDLVWDITASGATSAVETRELNSILEIARLAAVRTI